MQNFEQIIPLSSLLSTIQGVYVLNYFKETNLTSKWRTLLPGIPWVPFFPYAMAAAVAKIQSVDVDERTGGGLTDDELPLSSDGHASNSDVPALDDLSASEGEVELSRNDGQYSRGEGGRASVRVLPWCWSRRSCRSRACRCNAYRPWIQTWQRLHLPSSSR